MKKILVIVAVVALVAVLGVVLFACAPSTVAKAEAKMKDAGYSVLAYSDDDAEGCDGGLTATKITETIFALHFSSSKDAKNFYNDSKDENGKSSLTLTGNWVCWGSEGAINAFKK